MILFDWIWFFIKLVWRLLFGIIRLVGWLIWRSRYDFRAQGALGTARWATRWQLFWAGVYRGRGPVVARKAFGRLMRFNQDGVMHVFGAPGAGKGLGIVVPTLLDYPGSMVVTDVKGENYAITARYRAKLGKVLMLNPSDLNHSARFNPMDSIRRETDHEQDDARTLASLMIVRDSSEGHWAAKATALLTILILDTLHEPNPENRTLAMVAKKSVGEFETLLQMVRDIAARSPSPLARHNALGFLGTMKHGDHQAPEFTSVLSDMQKATEIWVEGTPAGRLSAESTFRLEDLTAPEVTTLFFCIDEEKLRSYSRWVRVMTGLTLNAIMRAKYSGRPKHKVVLLLDEARMLGHLDVLSDNLGLLRTYCTPVLIWQNMPQLRSVYGREEAEAMLGNAACRVFLGVADNETAQEVSRACGQAPVRTRSRGTSHHAGMNPHENRSRNENESGYWLVDPSEVQRIPTTRVIIKMRHVANPIFSARVDYRSKWRWLFRWDRWRPQKAAPIVVAPPSPPKGPFVPEPRYEEAPGLVPPPPRNPFTDARF
ncbi:type IV secretory system conjugative DNA transfer family protein [Aestuariivirga litoralis]|uniref:type IV secretory system conjugative DNA transfer family protein n=1 Tax=Aestuariivirga litoralis TaxID=2650924 RepID=UPI0018C49922|nr:type IV secretory system conjugative DNA transfer family protein [Aestuariivirga litoralis]MBG1233967.1 type IV secretory system conjugative DNA transfer family protein [Aestuariivirga litoralis]